MKLEKWSGHADFRLWIYLTSLEFCGITEDIKVPKTHAKPGSKLIQGSLRSAGRPCPLQPRCQTAICQRSFLLCTKGGDRVVVWLKCRKYSTLPPQRPIGFWRVPSSFFVSFRPIGFTTTSSPRVSINSLPEFWKQIVLCSAPPEWG